MERRVGFRDAHRRASSAAREPCREYIRGSCRFGPSCRFSHELPPLPSAEICRYFQKGVCWFGDLCRYQHILQPDGRGPSAPPLDRRGSEPSIPPARGSSSWPRRGSEPLVTGMVNLQHNFERLSMGVVEEEEHVAMDAGLRPRPQQGSWSQPGHRGQNVSRGDFPQRCLRAAPTTTPTPTPGPLVARTGPIIVTEVKGQESGAGKQPMKSSSQQGAAGSGAAAPAGRVRAGAAYRQSKGVMCGICMDTVYEKPVAQRRFGILPNCSHAFCLACIVTWRKTKDFQDEVIKACPQCRVKSTYYIPSKYWVSDGEQKRKLIAAFKKKSSKIKCSIFLRNGCCPFKSDCIYRHELPNGYHPPPQHRRSSTVPSSVSLEDLDSDSLQLLHYILALTLLDDDDVLDEEDYFQLYLDEEGDPL